MTSYYVDDAVTRYQGDSVASLARPGSTVLDPFSGSGTTGLAATRAARRYIGIDLNEGYLKLSLRTRA